MRYTFYSRDKDGDADIGTVVFERNWYVASNDRIKDLISNTMTLEGEPFDPKNEDHIAQIPVIYSGSFFWAEPSDNGNETDVLLYLKQKEDEVFAQERKITGNPIPKQEVERGAYPTKNTIRDELERWKKHPILSKYVPTDEELQKILEKDSEK